MKILAINIKNLASLEGETCINFRAEPLCSAGIFAITGPTGAGKSTILDALCLALYARTPRFDKASGEGIAIADVKDSSLPQNDPRSILRDGTGDGFAEVIFEAIDGEAYRCRWTVRRARGKAEGALQPYQMNLWTYKTGQPFGGTKTEVLAEIERLAGLNFHQFTRSVLLAQGEFTAFLKSARDDKASLLEKLTGSQIYSQISKVIHQKCKAAAVVVADLQSRAGGITIFDDEAIALRQAELGKLKGQINGLQLQDKILKEQLQWHKEVKLLEASVAAAQEALADAQQMKTDAASRFEKMRLIEKVQDIAVPVNQLREAENKLETVHEKLLKFSGQLAALQEQEKACLADTDTASEDLHAARMKLAEAEPDLQRASELDVLLLEKKKQAAQLRDTFEKATALLDDTQKKLGARKKDEEGYKKEAENIRQWYVENQEREPVAKSSDVIITRLSEAEKTVESIKEYQSEQAAKSEQQKSLLLRKKELQKFLAQENAIAEKLRSELKVKQVGMERFSGLDLVAAHRLETGRLQSLLSSITCRENLLDGRERLRQSRERITNILARQTVNQSALHEAEKRLNERKLIRDTQAGTLERARTEQSKSVEKLRAMLSEDEPCAVCGSRHHPYSHGYDQPILKTLEEEFRLANQEYDAALRDHSGATTDAQNIADLLRAGYTDRDKLQVELDALDAAWHKISAGAGVANLPDEEVSGHLQDAQGACREKIAQIDAEIEIQNKTAGEISSLKDELERAEKKLTTDENTLKDIGREHQSLQESMDAVAKLIAKDKQGLIEVETALAPFFSSAAWFEKWQGDPGKFIDNIRRFSENWISRTQQLEGCEKKLAEVSAEMAALEAGRRKEKEHCEEQQRLYAGASIEQQETEVLRKAIFDGLPVQEIRSELMAQLEAAEKKLNACTGQLNALRKESAVLVSAEKDAHVDAESLSQKKQALHEEVSDWIARCIPQISLSDIHGFLQHPASWKESEKADLLAIENRLSQAQTILTERNLNLQNHHQKRQGAIEEPELLEKADAITDELKAARDAQMQVEVELMRDHENRNTIAGLLAQISAMQKTADDWAALNEMIGSADGKKFRQIAQEYTLDILLEFANIELEALAKRYSLQRIPGSLGLQVVDHDMGDEVRTVFSLSGGESFLLSLALALGLSSLSSSQMRVESLFIDEGFGALDPQTLNIAMDALERLYDQGRKVGVISHVQEMTERIPVQIRVHKVAAGRSVAEVIGG